VPFFYVYLWDSWGVGGHREAQTIKSNAQQTTTLLTDIQNSMRRYARRRDILYWEFYHPLGNARDKLFDKGAKENVWSSIGFVTKRRLAECPQPAGDNLRATTSSARLPNRTCEHRSDTHGIQAYVTYVFGIQKYRYAICKNNQSERPMIKFVISISSIPVL
jgi:hypothetical protein